MVMIAGLKGRSTHTTQYVFYPLEGPQISRVNFWRLIVRGQKALVELTVGYNGARTQRGSSWGRRRSGSEQKSDSKKRENISKTPRFRAAPALPWLLPLGLGFALKFDEEGKEAIRLSFHIHLGGIDRTVD